MGLEVDKPDFGPEDLNSNWPLGSENLSQGDNHIRLIKKSIKNFYSWYLDYKVLNENRFDNDKAKEALFSDDANKLGGILWDQYALRNGDYQFLRARGTTKEDVNLGNVDNFPTADKIENNSRKFTPVSLLYQLKADLEKEIEAGKLDSWAVPRETITKQSTGVIDKGTLKEWRIRGRAGTNLYVMLPSVLFRSLIRTEGSSGASVRGNTKVILYVDGVKYWEESDTYSNSGNGSAANNYSSPSFAVKMNPNQDMVIRLYYEVDGARGIEGSQAYAYLTYTGAGAFQMIKHDAAMVTEL